MKEITDYKLYPKSKERLIEEIITAFDDYDNDKLEEEAFINLMHHYQSYSSDEKLIGEYYTSWDKDTFRVNPQTKKRIGKGRSDRLEKILNRI